MHDTYLELKDKLNETARFLAGWGLSPEEIQSEAFEAFAHAYNRYDPKKQPNFEKYAVQTVWFRARSNVRDRMRVERKHFRKREKPSSGWEDNLSSPEPDGTRVGELTGDALKIVSLVLNPPDPLWFLVQKYSNWGSTSAKYAWSKALREYLKSRHWTRSPWPNERIRTAFTQITSSVSPSSSPE